MSGNVWRDDSYVLSLMSSLSIFKRNSTLLPGTEVILWGRLGSPLVNILFRTKLLSLVPLSWDMDYLLTLWLTLPLAPLVTVAIHLVFWTVIPKKSFLYFSLYILIEKSLKHLCFIKLRSAGLLCVCVSFCFSLSLSFSGWLSGAWRPVMLTFLPRLLRPPREGTWCLRERCKSCVKDFIGPLRKPRDISLFLSFTFLSSTPYHKVLVH